MINYKKLLAEKMARDKTNRGEMVLSSKLSDKSGRSSTKKSKEDDKSSSKSMK